MSKSEEVTLESVRQRLMELHPGASSSVGVDIWDHGAVKVHLSLHPPEVRPRSWNIFAEIPGRGSSEPIELRKARALAQALEKVERGEWQKPLVFPDQATVLAG